MISDLIALKGELNAVLGASAQYWPNKTPKLDDYYEAYLWAETIAVARSEGWSVAFANVGSAGNQFDFRMGPGLLTAGRYSYAIISMGGITGELHIGVRVIGDSATLHEFDVLGLDQAYRNRSATGEPQHSEVRLHIEAKFHKSDISLGIGRGLVGLGADCPNIEPFLVAKNAGSPTVRTLIKHHGGHFVENVFPGKSGVDPYFRTCIRAALRRW